MENKLFIKSIRSPNYQRYYAVGLWGGISPDGRNLSFDIYEDMPPLNTGEILTLEENGEVINREAIRGESSIERFIHAGVTIPLTEIPNIIKWLQNKLDEVDKIKRGENNE